MNIILTGSLGHISKPLTQILVQKGHSVTVIGKVKLKDFAKEFAGVFNIEQTNKN